MSIISGRKKRSGDLPKILWRYGDSPYITALKAKFTFNLSIGLALFMVFLIGASMSIHIISVQKQVFIPTVIIFSISVLFYLACAWFIVRGYVKVVSQVLILYSFLLSWFVIFIDGNDALGRLDNIFIIYSAMSILPILIDKKPLRVFAYVGLNIVMSYIYIFCNRDNLGLLPENVFGYLLDVTLTVLFIGFVSYSIIRINRNALDRAQSDAEKKIEAERKVFEGEQRFKGLVEFFPQVIFEMNRNGMLTFINEVASDLFGYTADDIKKGLSVFDVLDKSCIELAKNKIKEIITLKRSAGVEYVMYKKNGELFDSEVFSGPIIIDNEVVGVRGVLIDISEQKRLEVERRKSEELFIATIEHSPSAITVSNMRGQIIMINNYFTRYTGITLEEAKGKTLIDLGIRLNFEPNQLNLHEVYTRGFIQNVEMSYKNKYGETLFFIFSCTRIELHGEKVILSSSIDITDRKKIEIELQKYRESLERQVRERTESLNNMNSNLLAANEEYASINEELMEANELLREQKIKVEDSMKILKETQKSLIKTEKMASIGLLASGIAHEINNPLNYIKGGIYGINTYINNNLNEHAEKLQPLIGAINTGINRASEIVKGLGRYSRQTDSKDEICDIQAIIEDCLLLLENQFKDRVEVKRLYLSKVLVVRANEGRLHQAFLNILANAVQAIANKGTIIVETCENEDYICTRITDSGCGMSKDIMSKIFEPFFTTKAQGKGTGLGLAITNEIINECGGTITVDSEINKGTTVTILLPYLKN